MLYFLKYCRSAVNFTSAIALGLAASCSLPIAASPALAQTANPVNQLSREDQSTLRDGQVVLEGENGQYTAQVLATAPLDTAWKVLTDYGNFNDFLPHIASTQILESDGSEKIYEQINVIRVLFFSRRSRVVIAASETYPSQIAFRVVEGEVKSLEGTWTLESVSPDQVLITHRVTVDPGDTSRDMFFNIYKNALRDTMAALKQEAERRSTAG